MAPFASPPRRRRRTVHLTGRDLAILGSLVTRRVETLDYLHETHFAGASRKRALNRLGELKAGGYLERTDVWLPAQEHSTSVYWLTKRSKNALKLRAITAHWFSTRSWKLEPDLPSIPHQIVTNRVCDWLGANAVPEHLLPSFQKSDGTYLRHRPDAIYEAREADERGRRIVLLEVDLGHYSRKRIIEKVEALREVPEARFVLLACPTDERCMQLTRVIRERFGSDIWDRVDVMTFKDIHAGRAPGGSLNPQLGLLPREDDPWRFEDHLHAATPSESPPDPWPAEVYG